MNQIKKNPYLKLGLRKTLEDCKVYSQKLKKSSHQFNLENSQGTLKLVQNFKPTRKLVRYFFLPGYKLFRKMFKIFLSIKKFKESFYYRSSIHPPNRKINVSRVF